jgi:hypothetical protein
MDLLDGVENTSRLGYFVVYIIGVLFLRQFFGRLTDTHPEAVDIQIARQDVLVQKVVKRVLDEDHEQDLKRENDRKAQKATVSIELLPTDPLEQSFKVTKLLQASRRKNCCR